MDLKELEIPKNKIEQLKTKGINSVEDLVRFLPCKYYDFRKVSSLYDVKDGDFCAIEGTVNRLFDGMGKVYYVKAEVKDKNSHKTLNVMWFNQKNIMYELKKTYLKEVIVCGQISYDEQYNSYTITSPLIFSQDIKENKRIYPVYSKIKGMRDEYLENTIKKGLDLVDLKEIYSKDLTNTFNLISLEKMIKGIHSPKSVDEIKEVKKRLIFEDLYSFAKRMNEDSNEVQKFSKYNITSLEKCNKVINELPFELTQDQKEAVENIINTSKEGKRINALVQGDVGCGKTIIAFLLMIAMADNGYQSVLMAPTGVLAKQHYIELKEKTESLGLKTAYLSGELKAKEKRELLAQIKNGDYDFIVGTHSVIGKDVEFKNLALTVVDEEHKFGVAQKEQLKEKSKDGVHNITMSATPIPRSLALTMYGDTIDVYTIQTMPNGRKPIKTAIVNNDKATFEFIRKQINEGHQCYMVCPLIEESTSEKLIDVESVEEAYKKVSNYFLAEENINIGLINGKMKAEDIEAEIDKFSRNEYQILVSTTIVEVGVNVPNATVIVIRNSERYGLAGLHQLRGRVGRSSYQSYCILSSTEKDNARLKAMCDTTSGFKIAEEDLKLRGTGDFIGTKQSGDNKYVMLMMAMPNLYKKIKEYVKKESIDSLVWEKEEN